jgi:uncharacterized protein (DUF2236 family)
VTWKLHREVVLLAGWGAAILLQLAHPLVAQGVAEHSAFLRETRGRVRRLRRTLESMLALTFGDEHEASRAVARINAIHDGVHGALADRHGSFAAGTRYSAHDPDLLAWVHATLVDTFIETYHRFVADLSDGERDRYCAESTRIEPFLGIPTGRLPRTHGDLRSYIAATLASGEIVPTDVARTLAREILHPPLPWPARPLTALSRLVATGLLPPAIRRAYDLPWSPRRERVLRFVAAASRLTIPLLPGFLRDWPSARQTIRRVGHSERR